MMVKIEDVLPVAIPDVILQMLIQAYFIKYCWENVKKLLESEY